MASRHQKPETNRLASASQESMIGPDLLNMCEFPTCLLGKHRVDGSRNTIFFRDRIYDEGARRPVDRELIITGSDFFGLPTSADSDVLLVLMFLTQRDGLQDRTLSFSRRELLTLLQWDSGGKSYKRLDESLHRWISVSLHFHRSWWDQKDLAWQSQAFTVLESIQLQGRSGAAGQETSRATWNSVIHASLESSNVKRLDLKVYFALRSPAARQAYRFLDKRFYRSRHLEFDLRSFACEHIGFSRSYDTGVLKSKLKRAIEELEEQGFLQPMPYHQRFQKLRCGQWRVQLARAMPIGKIESTESNLPPPDENTALVLLRQRGVSVAVARRLIEEYPAASIEEKIRDVDQLAAKGRTPPRDRAAFLVAAIRGGYKLGDSMIRRKKSERTPKRLPAQPPSQGRILVEADDLASANRSNLLWQEFCRLPQEEADGIEQAALTAATPLVADTYRRLKGSRPKLFETVRMSLIVSYLERCKPDRSH